MARRKEIHSATRYTLRTANKAAVGLFKWATTDHSGMSKALDRMPQMGLLDTLGYILRQLLFTVVGAVLTAIWVMVLIFYGIPFLITGHF